MNTITVCTPAANANVSSPVSVLAAANSTAAMQFMQIYVDNLKVYQVNGGSINTSIPLTAGKHYLVVQGYNGAYFKTPEYVTEVNSGPQPISVIVSPALVTVAPGATEQFSVTVSNASTTAVNWMVDGVAGGSAASGTIDNTGFYTAPSTLGTHTVAALSQADNTTTGSARGQRRQRPERVYVQVRQLPQRHQSERDGADTGQCEFQNIRQEGRMDARRQRLCPAALRRATATAGRGNQKCALRRHRA